MSTETDYRWEKILRRAEHEVSYSAKRAIEMYIEVWEKEPAMYLFEGPISKNWCLSRDDIKRCVALMEEYGMGDPPPPVERPRREERRVTWKHNETGNVFTKLIPDGFPVPRLIGFTFVSEEKI